MTDPTLPERLDTEALVKRLNDWAHYLELVMPSGKAQTDLREAAAALRLALALDAGANPRLTEAARRMTGPAPWDEVHYEGIACVTNGCVPVHRVALNKEEK